MRLLLDYVQGLRLFIKLANIIQIYWKPFGAPADPASVTPLRIHYFIYRMRNVVIRRRMRMNVR